MTVRNDADAIEWIAHSLQLSAVDEKKLEKDGVGSLYVSQLEIVLNELSPHMAYAVKTPTEKDEYVQIIETALKDSSILNSVQKAMCTEDGDTEKLSPFRQAFGQAILNIMGNKFEKKKSRKSRRNRATRPRRRAHSTDGLVSSDDEASVDDDAPVEESEPVPPPTPSSRRQLGRQDSHDDSSGVLGVPTNITMDHTEGLENQVYTTSLNDSSRGGRISAVRPRPVNSRRNQQLSNSASSGLSDSSDDHDLRSYDGYASSDDDNFMNDVGHKGLPGGRDYLSDDGSVDSCDSFDFD